MNEEETAARIEEAYQRGYTAGYDDGYEDGKFEALVSGPDGN